MKKNDPAADFLKEKTTEDLATPFSGGMDIDLEEEAPSGIFGRQETTDLNTSHISQTSNTSLRTGFGNLLGSIERASTSTTTKKSRKNEQCNSYYNGRSSSSSSFNVNETQPGDTKESAPNTATVPLPPGMSQKQFTDVLQILLASMSNPTPYGN